MPRRPPIRVSTPRTSTTGPPATCTSTIYCRATASRPAAPACSGHRGRIPRRAWCGAIRRQARITGWCGPTSAQTDLRAHRTMIRKPVIPGIRVIEHHPDEGFRQDAGCEVAPEEDVVDELAVLAGG